MGVCEAPEENPSKKKHTPKEKKQSLQKIDENASVVLSRNNADERIEILQRGFKDELEELVNSEDDIDAYSFGKNKTLLIQACISCKNDIIIDLIMEKEADIDLQEANSGNPAIFLAALDLKVNFVKKLLKYEPDLRIKNYKKQDIFAFLEEFLIERNKQNNRELDANEKEKYDEIKSLLKEALAKSKKSKKKEKSEKEIKEEEDDENN